MATCPLVWRPLVADLFCDAFAAAENRVEAAMTPVVSATHTLSHRSVARWTPDAAGRMNTVTGSTFAAPLK